LLLTAQEPIHLPSSIPAKKKMLKEMCLAFLQQPFLHYIARTPSNSAAATTVQLVYAVTSHAQPSGQF
jgi:hypothetical protein